MCNNYSKEVLKLIKKFKNNSWEFGKPEEIISHDFSKKLSYQDIINTLSSLEDVEFTHKEKRDGEDRYTIYVREGKYRGKTFVITFRREKIRVITVFPMGKKTYIKYHRRKFKRMEYINKT